MNIDKERSICIDKLTFEPHKKYALLGMSGSGKSSLLSVLLGYEKVDGKISVFNDGHNPYGFYTADTILYIAQDSYILNADLVKNIELWHTNNDEKLKKIIDLLQLDYLKGRDLGIDG